MKESDRNLLFGILAVQLEFITSDQLVDAASKWMLNKSTLMGDLLVRNGIISESDANMLESLVDRHVARSGSVKDSLRRAQSYATSSEVSKAVELVTQLGSETVADKDSASLTQLWAGDHSSGGQRFNVLRELARGGLGEVFVARDQELDREVALKKIIKNKSISTDVQQRFVAEAKITGSLEHPGVVPVYGLGSFADGSPFYAMRLIRGQSLYESIGKLYDTPTREHGSPMFDREFRHLLRSVIEACYAIGYAHSRGVLHRDIKPHNIMLGKYGETLVVDWGLAKATGHSDDYLVRSELPVEDSRTSGSGPTMMGTVLGTPGFMSPEQAEGRLDILDRRSDVFSLGATLYMVLTGQVPYQGKHRADVLRAARNCDFKPPRTLNPNISKALEAICLKAMSKSPDDRYATALELADDLDAWVAGVPVTAYPESLAMRAFRFARRHQTAVASVLVFLLVTASGLLIANRAISYQRDQARIERDKAEDARVLAQKEREKAEAATEIAEHNSEVSIEILDQFVKTLADERWSQIPNFEKDRQRMVELGLERFTELLEESPENATIKKQVCQLLIRSANIHRMAGHDDLSLERINRAKSFASELAIMFADDPLFLGLYSDTLVYASVVLEKQAGPALALEEVNLAVKLSQTRLAMKTDNQSQVGLSLALSRRGEIQRFLGSFDLSIADLEQAIDVISQSRSKFRTILLSSTHSSLAETQLLAGALSQAVLSANAAIEVVAPSLAKTPDTIDLVNIRGSAVKTLAAVALCEGNYPLAKQHIEDAIAAFRKLTHDVPDNKNLQRLLVEAQQLEAELALRQGNLKNCQQFARGTLEALIAMDAADDNRPLELISHSLLCASCEQPEDAQERKAMQSQFDKCREQVRATNANDPSLTRANVILAIGRQN